MMLAYIKTGVRKMLDTFKELLKTVKYLTFLLLIVYIVSFAIKFIMDMPIK